MSPCRFLLFSAVFTVGFATACLTSRDEKKRQDEPLDVAAPVRIIRCTDPGLKSYEFTPFRVVVDGEGRAWPIRPKDAPSLASRLGKREVVLFAVEKPAE